MIVVLLIRHFANQIEEGGMQTGRFSVLQRRLLLEQEKEKGS